MDNTRLFTLRCFTILHFPHSIYNSCNTGCFCGQDRTRSPAGVPCPQQMMKYRCEISVPSFAVQWTLPTGGSLDFGHAENIGAVYVSYDNAYSATLTNKTEDPNSASRYFFTSTLLVMEPVNGSNLTCVGVTGAVEVKEITSIILSGKNCCNRFLPTYNFA